MSIWLLPLVPVAGAFAILAAARATGLARLLTTIALIVVAGTLGVAIWAAVALPVAEWTGWGPRFDPRLEVSGLGRIMVVLVPVIALPVILFAGGGSRTDRALPRLLALLTGFVGVMELLVVAADFLTLLIAWELAGAFSWALIGHEWTDTARPRAARDAFITTRVGDLGLYAAAAAAFAASGGSLRFTALGTLHAPMLGVIAGGVLVAAAAKSAQLPFSPWLFSAMAGPTPASALLHSATMVAAGAYLLARLTPALSPAVIWFGPSVALLGVGTAIAAGIVASLQPDLKKALAASTSAQYGLMFVAIGAGYPGAAGTHLVTHAAFKALLFLGAGVALHASGTLDLRTLRSAGLRRHLGRIAALFAVGALALGAVPPLGGAYSKELIVGAAARAERFRIALVAGVLIAGLLSAFYAARLQLLAFARPAHSDLEALPGKGATPAELLSLVTLAALSIALGALWLPNARRIAERLTGSPAPPNATWEIAGSLATVAAGIGAAWLLRRHAALETLGLPDAARERAAAWLGIPSMARVAVINPVTALARALAAMDERVVDAGVRGATIVAARSSRALAWLVERGIDGVVRAIARSASAAAVASSAVDTRGVDRIVEDLAHEVGRAGTQSRRLQSGLTHDYYSFIAAGTVVIMIAAAVIILLGQRPRW